MRVYRCTKCKTLCEVPDSEVPVTCRCGNYQFAAVEGQEHKLEALMVGGSTLAIAPAGKTEA